MSRPSRRVTSIDLCQLERGADAAVSVFADKHGEQDAVHRSSIGEDPHGPGAASDFAEAAFNGIGRTHAPALSQGGIAPAGQQLIEIVAQTGDGFGINALPAIGEAASGGASAPQVGRVHEAMQVALDGGFDRPCGPC